MKNRNIIIVILIILISGSVFTSCGSSDSELEKALENGDVSSHDGGIVTVNSGSGDGSYFTGVKVNITADAAPTGQEFDKWEVTFGDPAPTIADASASSTTLTMTASDVAVTATYKDLAEYELTVNDGSGDGYYFSGENVTITADAAPKGKAFDYWEVASGDPSPIIVDANASSTTLTMSASDATVTAIYKDLPKYVLTVDNGTGDSSYFFGTPVIIKADPAPIGQEFNVWVKTSGNPTIADLNEVSTTLTMPANNVTVTATFKIRQYALTVIDGSGGGDYESEKVIDIIADDAPPGKEFDKWIVDSGYPEPTILDANDSSTTLTMSASDAEVTAIYKDLQKYKLIVDSGSAEVSGDGSDNYYSGEKVIITAAATQPGKGFDKWEVTSGDPEPSILDANASSTTLTMKASAATVTATYIVKNNPPVAEAGVDQTVTLADSVTLNGSESFDPDGDEFTYSWEFTLRPPDSVAVLKNPETSAPSFTADKAGVYKIRLSVNDGKDSDTDTVSITANTPPVADAGNSKNVPLGSGITLDGLGSSDSDDDSLTYVWRFLSKPSGSAAVFDHNAISDPLFTADAFGKFEIELVVNDGHVDSEPDIVEIVVVGAVPDTGQTKCYKGGDEIPCPSEGEAFYGQDASYTINPPSYTKLDSNGNDLPFDAINWAMVKDNVTGFIWEVKTDDDGVHDKDNEYTWYSNSDTNGGNAGTPGDRSDTEYFINKLNSDNFGGHSDWRLPNVKELKSIVDTGVDNPISVNGDYFKNTMSSNYWSSTTSVNNTDNAWRVSFDNGYVVSSVKSTAYYVRAVRGGQPIPSFTNNGNGTITDNNTGLIWMQATADTGSDGIADSMNWENALSYCENLKFAEQSDWRLPTDKELLSIVDYNNNPAIYTDYFPDTKSSYYWSPTTQVHAKGYAWLVSLGHGGVSRGYKPHDYYVRAVRGGQ